MNIFRKKTVLVLFLLGLIYILVPDPKSIASFKPLPDSLKSNEPGDTVQVKDVAAYFSDFDRKGITNFYFKDYSNHFFWGKLIPPVKINYPPQAAYQYVRDLQESTFLEEYVYPLRGSIFVNGVEPYVYSEIKGFKHSYFGDHIYIDGHYYVSKTTLRYYSSDWYVRLLVYVSIWLSVAGMIVIFKKSLKENI